MSEQSSISDKELSLLTDQQFLLTKRVIDSKVTKLLLDSQEGLRQYILESKPPLPSELTLTSRKVAKGENYGSLPYWASDFPAVMNKDHIWSFRTVVWWGHEISFSLILKGNFKPKADFFEIPSDSVGICYSIHTDPWMLEQNSTSTIAFCKASETAILEHHSRSDFTKLTVKIELEKINLLRQESVSSFIKLFGCLKYLA